MPLTMNSRCCGTCGAELKPGGGFCERCGAAVDQRFGEEAGAAAEIISGPDVVKKGGDIVALGSSRGKRIMLAIGLFVIVVFMSAIWISFTFEAGPPPVGRSLATSEELFPVKPAGVDSINNTIDGRKVIIEGDGHVMNSPGLGVNRPVWCLNGPTESVFTVPVRKATDEEAATFSARFQILVPVLSGGVEDPGEAAIRLSFIDLNGEAEVKDFRMRGANLWQPLEVTFTFDPARAPYRLRFQATGFEGAFYIDQIISSAEFSAET